MQDFKPNSNRFKKEEQKKTVSASEKRAAPKKVIKGPVKVKKKSVLNSAIDDFVNEDLGNIKTYLISDVIIPTIKNTVWDAFTNTLDMILFKGDGRNRRNGPGSSRVPYVSYNKCSSSQDARRPANEPRRQRYDFSTITFTNKQDAEEVLHQMDAIMDSYEMVTVSDLYDLIGETGEYTDQKYGWTNIRNANVVRGRDGYYINLPKPLPID